MFLDAFFHAGLVVEAVRCGGPVEGPKLHLEGLPLSLHLKGAVAPFSFKILRVEPFAVSQSFLAPLFLSALRFAVLAQLRLPVLHDAAPSASSERLIAFLLFQKGCKLGQVMLFLKLHMLLMCLPYSLHFDHFVLSKFCQFLSP